MSELDDPQVARLYRYVQAPSGAAIVIELTNGVALRAILCECGLTDPESVWMVVMPSEERSIAEVAVEGGE